MLSTRTPALESLEPRSLFSAAPGLDALGLQPLGGSATVVTATAADAGETTASATSIGRFDVPKVRFATQNVGDALGDNVDYFKFRVTRTMHFTLTLSGLTDDLDLSLQRLDGSTIETSISPGATAENIVRVLTPGWYAVKVSPFFLGESDFTLKVRAGEMPPDAGNSLATATALTAFSTPKKINVAQVTGGAGDTGDWYKFRVNQQMNIKVRLRGMTDDLDLGLYRPNNTLIESSTDDSGDNEFISQILTPGWYYIRVDPYDDAHSAYALQVESVAINSIPTATAAPAVQAVTYGRHPTLAALNPTKVGDHDKIESVLDMILPAPVTLG